MLNLPGLARICTQLRYDVTQICPKHIDPKYGAEVRDYSKQRPPSALGNTTPEEYPVQAEPKRGPSSLFGKSLTEWVRNGVRVTAVRHLVKMKLYAFNHH